MTDRDVLELTDGNWEQLVERNQKPVVVMFYSPTCPHCRTMEPYFKDYAVEYRETVVFGRLNVAVHQWISERYGVRGTPTFKFFCGGKPIQEMVGAVYPALLKKRIEEVLIYGEECAEKSTEINYDVTGYA